jgi:hypothetical protein
VIECGRTVPRGLIAIFSYADQNPQHRQRGFPTRLVFGHAIRQACKMNVSLKPAVVRTLLSSSLAIFLKILIVSMVQVCFRNLPRRRCISEIVRGAASARSNALIVCTIVSNSVLSYRYPRHCQRLARACRNTTSPG